MSITGTIVGAEGATAAVSSRFQVGGCGWSVGDEIGAAELIPHIQLR